MQSERQHALCQSREQEARLLDAQNSLMEKVREVSAARDVQTGLKSEIASLTALIESAERRYCRVRFLQALKWVRTPFSGPPFLQSRIPTRACPGFFVGGKTEGL